MQSMVSTYNIVNALSFNADRRQMRQMLHIISLTVHNGLSISAQFISAMCKRYKKVRRRTVIQPGLVKLGRP
jgi:hypothetical protein